LELGRLPAVVIVAFVAVVTAFAIIVAVIAPGSADSALVVAHELEAQLSWSAAAIIS